jgi:hypothetical protein
VPTNRLVSRDREEIEFKPIPGSEEEWAMFQYIGRSRIWDWLGLYPVGLYFICNLMLIGLVAI